MEQKLEARHGDGLSDTMGGNSQAGKMVTFTAFGV
jgi:hypothetical protein